MADLEDVRRIAGSLPETIAEMTQHGQIRLNVAGKGFAWTWMERVAPRKPRVGRPDVLAVRVADKLEKEILLAADDRRFFTEPHYNGFPAVLVRLSEIDADELSDLLMDAWRAKAPKKLVKESEIF